ncbi:hypothetical protein Tco_1568686 [Tanacetum coccineum]
MEMEMENGGNWGKRGNGGDWLESGTFQDFLKCKLHNLLRTEDALSVKGLIGVFYGVQNSRNVIAANPTRLQDAIRIANQLMDKKVQGYAARSAWRIREGWKSNLMG